MRERQRYVVAGGSGLIGSALTAELVADGHEVVVLSRSAADPPPAGNPRSVGWDGRSLGAWAAEIDGAAAVINLAGANLAGGRWTAARKRRLRSSRLEPTRALVEAMAAARSRPRVLIQASGADYYGADGDERLDEEAPPGRGFLAELCREWEAASAPAADLGVRRAVARSAMVLAREGGALAKMLPAFRLGVGGPVGDGRQPFPWIHIADEVAAIRFLADDERAEGPFNLAAPEPPDNREFSRALGRALGRPAVVRLPAFALRLALGELADVLLGGGRVVPRRLIDLGFRFRHAWLDDALADLVGGR
jgi:hypothetical protein